MSRKLLCCSFNLLNYLETHSILRSRKVLFFCLLAVYLNFLKYTPTLPPSILKLKLLSGLFKISTLCPNWSSFIIPWTFKYMSAIYLCWILGGTDVVVGVPLEGASSPVVKDDFGMTSCTYRNKPIPGCLLGHQWKLSCSPNFPCKESGHLSLASYEYWEIGNTEERDQTMLTFPKWYHRFPLATAFYILHWGSQMLVSRYSHKHWHKALCKLSARTSKICNSKCSLLNQGAMGDGRKVMFPFCPPKKMIRLIYSSFISGHIYARFYFPIDLVVVHASFLKQCFACVWLYKCLDISQPCSNSIKPLIAKYL